ncbi:site-specific integrase [Niveibacterium sp. 24ML]|uniref:site-specific integrase n=1 Tax=Niveibacterium sp. 24ML TaxID=2985512 RepID=UPI00226D4BDE|nr:site-specific integrase [Niveibacterium sp. 24ML]MCX9154609.1 site-specific integrase [Niveibacterium sp. 24ML]
MTPTYQQLDDRLRAHFGIDDEDASSPPLRLQQYRNCRTALLSFLAYCGKTLDSAIGAELTFQFERRLSDYLAQLDVAPRTRRDRRTQLLLLQRLHNQGPISAAAPRTPGRFEAELRRALSAQPLAPKTLSRELGISPSLLQRWLKGATPNQRGIAPLRRLEHALGLARDTLVRLIDKETSADAAPPVRIHSREVIRERCRDTYRLHHEDFSEAFRREWRALLTEKTSTVPALERAPKGAWRLLPISMVTQSHPLGTVGMQVCPTAVLNLQHLASFYGWLRNWGTEAGIVPPGEFSDALAWLAVPAAIEAYLQFMTERSQGLRHGGHLTFTRFVASLVRERVGYLYQQRDLAERLPQCLRPESDDQWRRVCLRTHKLANTWRRTSSDISRAPDAPIAHLLESDSPLRPILLAIRELQKLAASAPSGSVSEATHIRDALLLSLLVSNPLRARTLATLTWSPSNSGSLYRATDGSWRIRLSSAALKNGGARRNAKYDVQIPPPVAALLEQYVCEARTTLLAGTSSAYLFVCGPRDRPWRGLSARVRKLTKRHIPGSPGFAAHAFRHLVASAWLKQHPNDFLTVAELLGDSLETVIAEYAHLKRDDSLARLSAHLSSVLDTVR